MKTRRPAAPARTRRARAEQLLGATRPDVAHLPAEGVQKLVQELQVHQIKLEMQNEELRQTQVALETVRDRFANLYDLAPSALLTLDAHAKILEANLSAGTLLGRESRQLLGQKFTRFIAAESQDTCYLLCRKVFNSDVRQNAELQLVNAQAKRLCVQFVVARDPHSCGQQCQVSLTDITERKQAEAALREFSQFNQQIIAGAKEGIIVNGRDLKHLVWNPFMEELTGLPAAAVIGKHPEEVFPFLRETGVIDHMHRALAGETVPPVEVPFNVPQSGRSGWASNSTSPLRNARGEIIGVIGIITDITERKRAEAALQVSEQKARAVLDHTFEFIGLLNRRGIVMEANQSALKFAGIPVEQVIGKPFWETPWWTHSAASQKQLRAAIRQTAAGKFVRFETTHPATDGTLHTIDFSLKPVRDERGRVIWLIPEGRDITERKRAEEALRRSEHHLATFFEQAPIGLVWLSASGTILRANLAQLDLLGYTAADYVGQFFNKFCADCAQGRELLERLANHETVRNFPITRRRRDGSIRHVLVDAHPLWDKEQFQYSSVFLRDITDRRELESEILQVGEREYRRIAQDLHDGLGQLLVGTAYLTSSLRDQLVVKGLAESRELGRILEVVYEAIAQTRHLARGIHPVEPEPNGLMVALQTLAERTKMLFKVGYRFTCRRPVMIADNVVATHLFRIAQEAITNAIKHGKPGRIHIRLATAAGRITLAIQDDGTGRPARQRKKTGMGLRIMRYRSAMIGGTVTIESPSSRGTTVACTVSLSSAGGGNSPSPAPAARRKK